MSVIRVNNITNRSGGAGPTIAGVGIVSSTSYMVVPTGRTGQRYADEGENIVRDGLVLYLDAKYSHPAGAQAYSGISTTSNVGIISTGSGATPDSKTWYDMSGNGNDGTLVGGVSYSTDGGGSLSFDGVDFQSGVLCPIVLSGNNLSSFTMEAWAKRTKSGSWQTVIGTEGSFAQIGFGNNNRFRGGRNGGLGGSLVSPGAEFLTTLDKWYHMVMTFDAIKDGYGSAANSVNYVTLYLNSNDGQLSFYLQNPVSGTGSNMGNNGSDNGITILGRFRNTSSSESLQGNISQARIYNRALSAAEVLQNYNATKARYGY